LSGSVGIIAKALQLTVSLYVIRLASKDLVASDLYLLFSVLAITNTLAFTDFGLGGGLTNILADPALNRNGAAMWWTNALVSLVSLWTVIVLVCAGLVMTLPNLFERFADVHRSAPALVPVLIGGTAMGLVAALYQRVLLGLQQSYLTHVVNAAISILSLVLLVTVSSFHRLVLADFVIVVVLLPGALWLAFASYHIWSRCPWLMPRTLYLNSDTAIQLIRTGLQIFPVQLIATACFQLDVIWIQYLGPGSWAGELALTQRLFQPVLVLNALFNAPLWAGYSNAMHCDDVAWIKRTLIKYLWLATALWTLLAFPVIWIWRDLLGVWLNDSSLVQPETIVAYCIWVLANLFGTVTSVCANGLGRFKIQWQAGIYMSVLILICRVFFTRACGLPGYVLGGTLAFVLTNLSVVTLDIFSVLRGKIASDARLGVSNEC
jgi:O-antigen/teichoic acid export membrane protein